MQTSITSQNQKKPINILLLLVCSLLILFKTMPIFQGYFSAYTELLLIVVCFILLFPIQRITFNNMVPVFVVAALFFLFQTFCRNDEWFLNIYNILHGSFKVILIYYLLNTTEENKKILKYLFWVLIISMTITQITSIIGLEEYPLIARYSITPSSEEMIAAAYGRGVSAAKLNITGYGTAYLLPIYTTLLFALMKRKKLHLVLFICHVVLSVAFIFATQFTLALLLYTITVIGLFLTDVDTKKMIAVSVIAILAVLVFSNTIAEFFEILAKNIEHDSVADRFQEISAFFAGESIEGTDLNTRFGDYSKSFNVFIKNFLWGGKLVDEHGGGHSAILDYLSQGGIWGFLLMINFFRMLYKKLFLPFSNSSYIRYINISFVFFFIASFFNPMFYLGTMSNFVFVLAGFCIVLFDQIKDDKITKETIS